MKLVVFSSAPIVKKDSKEFLYVPYEKEMQLWAKYANSIQFCCPIWKEDKRLLIAPISFEKELSIKLIEFDITSFRNILRAIPVVFIDFVRIFKAMKRANHIHLRCPGNIGLLASIIQILFPKVKKTAKYAGNWDPNSKQPFTYKLQRWILSNTFLTRNMQVLVYGDWENQTKNIKPFFTATYSKNEIIEIPIRKLSNKLKFIFVGTLSSGKNPIYAVQLLENLSKHGFQVDLELYGEGKERKAIEDYIHINNLSDIITLKGNQSQEIIKRAYQESHFLILPSKSEGWPKVVAEAMFWGCIPLASPVSCVPYMMGNGSRGVVLKEKLLEDSNQIVQVINNQENYQKMTFEGQLWSQQFTTETFEVEICKLLKV